MAEELSPRFDPKEIEEPLYQRWWDRGYFHMPSEEVLDGGRDPYVIVIPPPNVTAVLHAGHGLNNTIQDLLIRWRRMQGRASEWVPGTDHAGIATQNVVERMLLEEEGKTRDDLGREAFIDRVWDFVDETGDRILEQLRAIGCSCDWERTRFTLDEGLSRAVREVFVRLYEKGLIYRGEYIINWCPRCLTALSNEEAEGQDTQGRLWDLRYPLPEEAWDAAEQAARDGAEAVGRSEDGGWFLTVSTTRPETMLGDTAVAVNPDDDRYRALVGREVILPLADRRIPVVADPHVDSDFGTGMVKVTPAHDPADFEMAQRNDLEVLNVMTEKAVMNENVPEAFRGLDRFDARQAVLDALAEEGLRGGSEEHEHSVPRCYRCDTVVEPRLSLQWFVKMEPLAKPALEASRDGTISFTPARWQKVYEHWLENIRDWCISRQLWWGHRIPVWYCDACDETIVVREDPTECPECGSGDLRQDEDVLDTWFSSWLWPFSTLGWPEETEDLEAFYPGHTMVTGPDILFFWVARMIMAGYEFLGEAPFTEVYLNGIVRDAQGRKMSKSLGNGIDPIEVVERFGADALRFTVVSSCAVGTDIYLDHEDLEGAFAPGRNFANKLWNAGRFLFMSVGSEPVAPLPDVLDDLEMEDRWILSRLQRTARKTTRELERFRLKEVADELYHFFWGDFADWYLELVKGRLQEGESGGTGDAGRAAGADGGVGEKSRQAARSTLVTVFDGILRLLHPIVPFVTTELWDKLPWPEGEERPEDLMVAPWPEATEALEDDDAEAAMESLQELITHVRSLRKEYGVPEREEVAVRLEGASDRVLKSLEENESALRRLARVGGVAINGEESDSVGAHAVLTDGTELFIPLEGVIDLDRERDRLRDEIENLQDQLGQSEARLANEQFVTKAPDEVVHREREKVEGMRDQMEKLEEKLSALTAG
ncbi:MAG: valine--tRNA ligase [Longimicrobiales bacterium]|nr:valine--tRNA ligase [Longimicrobiales bacterium]